MTMSIPFESSLTLRAHTRSCRGALLTAEPGDSVGSITAKKPSYSPSGRRAPLLEGLGFQAVASADTLEIPGNVYYSLSNVTFDRCH